MGGVDDTEKLDFHSVGGQLVKLSAGWDGEGCVRGKAGGGGTAGTQRSFLFLFVSNRE